MSPSIPPVGRRGPDPFRQRDVVRVMKSAMVGGIEKIAAIEVITKDGTTIRVFGNGHEPNDTPENVIANL
jgi:hypothetical protein